MLRARYYFLVRAIQFLFVGSFVVGIISPAYFSDILFKEPSPVGLTTDISDKEKSEHMLKD